MSDRTEEPLTVELAALPREQTGPFLLLGADKTMGAEQLAALADECLARGRQRDDASTAGDLEWARAVVLDTHQRLQGDLASLNADTADQMVSRLAASFIQPSWAPLDPERPPDAADMAVPDPARLRATLVLPDMPPEAPAATALLEQWVRTPLDPWAVELVGLPATPARTATNGPGRADPPA